MNQADPPDSDILGVSINPLPLDQHIELMLHWARQNISRTVCVANVQMLLEAHWNSNFKQLLLSADLVVPEGMLLVWILRLFDRKDQERIDGIDILKNLCQESQTLDLGVFFLGSGTQILGKMRQRLAIEYPKLNIIDMAPLPFRALTSSEDQALVHRINQSQAGLLLLSIGCPKQERWLAAHRGKINATIIGLGGAFPIYAGIQPYAPKWSKELGLEWVYHLCHAPGRLWRRYITSMPTFLWLVAQQLLNQPKKH